MLKKLSDLHEIVRKRKEPKRLVLAAAHDEHSLEAVSQAAKKKYIEAILVGDADEIKRLAEVNKKVDVTDFQIIHEPDFGEAVAKAVKLVHYGEADILMKGNVGTSVLLKGVLNKEWGLRKADVLSHIALFEVEAYHHKLLALTDVAMNIAPDLNTKIAIISNSVDFLRKIGVQTPKVAVLGAVELVNESMPATIDAALLSKMAERGQIKDCIIDGPLAFDNAISAESAKHKGIKSSVAGDADLLLLPDIEAGNVLYKSFVFFANAKVAAVILGARAPIVLTSRSDKEESKLDSIVLAAAID
jgi:phosphate butyryltransferase